jgi:hypothetical protein
VVAVVVVIGLIPATQENGPATVQPFEVVFRSVENGCVPEGKDILKKRRIKIKGERGGSKKITQG